MSDEEEHRCSACGSVRRTVFAEPLTKDYELVSLACPRCKTILNFVHELPAQIKRRRHLEIGLKAK
jgi:phage FluMu protein Com